MRYAQTGNAGDSQVAIIGMACRFPMAPSPGAFWRLLRSGGDAVTDAPAGRRADNVFYDPGSRPDGAATTHRGGFLDQIDGFDADFFGISPREARELDPQQRLMLELAWEVFEDARMAPDSASGHQVGVYVGAIADDYAELSRERGLVSVTGHTLTGLHRGFIANRISYALGLRGPSLTVDTGQSSSLVAVHLACAGLRRGECAMAVAGGVHLNIAAHSTAQVVKLGALSPDGICAVFDERADGFVRGEGAGAVLLKPLESALADGDKVYCVIRGSAVNNDGDTSGSLAAPGELAQREVLRAAYRSAGVRPARVQYVELHGTGTRAGDPVEAAALAAVCGATRAPGAPLLVGSVKTNIGHLEGAAGIAGLIKTALSICHREIPASLHFRSPNPAIPLGRYRLRVRRDLGKWPDGEPLAGVSSFGLGGTNCHVVLAGLRQAGRAATEERATAPGSVPFVLSGRTDDAVRAQAAGLAAWAGGQPGLDLGDLAFSLATTRTAFGHRAAILASGKEALLAGLGAVADGGRAAYVLRGVTGSDKLGFLFPGQGFQRALMGERLCRGFPAFEQAFDAVCGELDGHLDRPIRPLIWARPGTAQAALLDQTRYTQPALFAVEVALCRLLESFGLRAEFVAGHSVGEFAAAHIAGVLSLADAARLVAVRARLMQELPPGGAMIAVQASADEVAPLLRGCEHEVAIAAINGPSAVVISGDAAAAGRVAATIAAKGRKTRKLKVSHAFHSPLMEPVLGELETVAGSLAFQPASGPRFVSAVTGRPASQADLARPGYWAEHARGTVRFASALEAMEAGGARLCLEVGPGNGLTGMGKAAMAGRGMTFLASMHGADEADAVGAALAGLHVRGIPVNWREFFGSRARSIDLPTYPFRRRRYWLGSKTGHREPPSRPAAAGDPHALVTAALATVLGHEEPARIDLARPLSELGLDSAMTVELAVILSQATGLDLQPTDLYNSPAPAALVEHLRELLAQRDRSPAEPAEPCAVRPAERAAGRASGRAPGQEQIAIVAMSCRYPGGVASPEDLWELVADGKDAISGFPVNRDWDLAGLYDPEPGQAGRSYVRHGGFLHDADQFDAAFFGISPREATAMDPQQRILLETCWEALERAGLAPSVLRGEPVGVFVGATAAEYGPRLHEASAGFAGHLLTGSTPSVLSGRVAYTLGLRGPAVTVDTACSSSLVALHLAAQALRNGDCQLALACGVTVMAGPGMFVAFSMQRGLAPDGRCKPFAAAADGTAWAEGAGVLVLERLTDARRHGHPVLAVIKGSATNQDGASNGLTAPNGTSQEHLIRQALANAGLTFADVDAVEAHGTGTALGDPIEATALLATYGQRSPLAGPLYVGALKSNIGHAQAAAGVGGVIKMVAAMRHGLLPGTLHLDAPSPHVDWSAGHLSLLTEARPWPELEAGRPRRAAVSSFGISGTNAHVILEQPEPASEREPASEPEPASQPEPAWEPGSGPDEAACQGIVPWVLSASSAQALAAQAGKLHEFVVQQPGHDAIDIAFSLGTTRAHLRHRAAVLGSTPGELRAALLALSQGVPSPAVIRGAAVTGSTVFVFPGQGSQWPGMALDLLESQPAFRARMEDCADALAPFTDWKLLPVLRGEPGTPPLARVDVVQPALFAIMVSLAAAWQAAGVWPGAVVGHSQGEIAAACVAGGLSLDDAAKVVALRSIALGGLAGTGAMASVPLPADEVRELLRSDGGPLSSLIEIAAVNGACSTTVAGPQGAVRDFVARCREADIRAREVDVDYASHSTQVEALRETLLTTLADIEPREAGIPFFSTVTGERLDTASLDAGYWYRNLRSTVRLEAATRALLRAGHTRFVEVSPHPILAVPVAETAQDADVAAAVIGTLRRDHGGHEQFMAALAQAHVAGAPLRWAALAPRARRVPLPTYQFQRDRFWLPARSGGGRADTSLSAAGLDAATHPLLGASIESPDSGELIFTGSLSLAAQPWLGDHRVGGIAVVSATTLLDLALHAGDETCCGQVDELTMQAPLVVPEHGRVQLRVVLGQPDELTGRSLAIYSRAAGQAGGPWTVHASGRLRAYGDSVVSRAGQAQWPPPGAASVPLGAGYADLAERGYGYGPRFRGLRAAWQRAEEIFAEVAVPEPPEADGQFMLHPVLLDSALHALLHLRVLGGEGTLLPFSWTSVRVHLAGAGTLRVRLAPDGASTVSMVATDSAGELVATVGGLAFRSLAAGTLAASAAPSASSGYLLRLDWTELTGWDDRPAAPRCAVLDAGDPGDPGPALPGTRFAGLGQLSGALEDGGAPPELVFAACPPAREGMPQAVHHVTVSTLALVKSWLAEERLASASLVVLTERAFAVGDDAGEARSAAVQAAVWGLLRSAQSENPGRLVLADVTRDDLASLRVLPAAAVIGEPQLALRDGRVFVPRLRERPAADGLLTLPALTKPATLNEAHGAPPWCLDTHGGGTIDDLAPVPNPRAAGPLAAGQVRIGVRAAGLNFRDITVALGLLPGERSIGIEGAGVVTEVGAGVSAFAPGDRVMGLFDGAFGPVAVADHQAVAAIPDGWSFAEAASVPVAFVTAYQCLREVAGLRAGERVVVHAATGGVGFAAVRLARYLGAEVFATASPGKWHHLKALGLDAAHISSSRSLGFARRFRTVMGERGADVVLNALAGDFTDASLGLLGPGGRFVEMGKTDIRDPAQVASRWPGVSYHLYNLRDVPPAAAGLALAKVLELFGNGALAHPPVTGYDIRSARTALTSMSRARHVGKIVLTVPRPLDRSGTVLITGGTGTLGGLLARHLVTAHGIRHLILASRRGASAAGAAGLMAELSRQGAEVTVVTCDVASRDALERAISAVPGSHPLTAVVHAAGLLDDATVASLTAESLVAVLAAKSDGAWHLHELTRHLDLAAFVLFSSVVGVLGEAGQANYAAANAALDGLARLRRSSGLPATSLCWGVWAERSGMTAHLSDSDLTRLRRSGIAPLATSEALRMFDAALDAVDPVLVPVLLDRAALAGQDRLPALLRGLAAAPASAARVAKPRRIPPAAPPGHPADHGNPSPLASRLAGLTGAERDEVLLKLVCAEAATVLGQTAAALTPDSTFRELGVDSLTGLELRNRLSNSTGLRLRASLTTDNPTPGALAKFLGNALEAGENGAGKAGSSIS
ncbi:MAG TPA: type I polyketide synthase [Streptosporangiaceae bacterium]|nr:type I polyketide synthase [Streptosporangiaceae bacterium]